MQRTIAVIVVLVVGILVGFVADRLRSHGNSAATTTIRSDDSTLGENRQLRSENEQLRQRIQTLTGEQERLAQENDILKREVQDAQLPGRKNPSLPDLPPK